MALALLFYGPQLQFKNLTYLVLQQRWLAETGYFFKSRTRTIRNKKVEYNTKCSYFLYIL